MRLEGEKCIRKCCVHFLTLETCNIERIINTFYFTRVAEKARGLFTASTRQHEGETDRQTDRQTDTERQADTKRVNKQMNKLYFTRVVG